MGGSGHCATHDCWRGVALAKQHPTSRASKEEHRQADPLKTASPVPMPTRNDRLKRVPRCLGCRLSVLQKVCQLRFPYHDRAKPRHRKIAYAAHDSRCTGADPARLGREAEGEDTRPIWPDQRRSVRAGASGPERVDHLDLDRQLLAEIGRAHV